MKDKLFFTVAFLLTMLFCATGAFANGCPNDYNNFNGPQRFYLNIHNCGLDCYEQEIDYLRIFREGITGVRIAPVPRDRTMAPEDAFYEVNDFDPYFNAALEIFGPENILVLVDDGVDEGRFAKPSSGDMERLLRSTLQRYPQLLHIEFMNEPSNFSGITPEEYAASYLPKARRVIDEFNAVRPAGQKIKLYSASWFGNTSGARETLRMVTAGGLRFVDVMTAHIYGKNADEARELAREYKRLARGKPVAVTETNFDAGRGSDYDTQQTWICFAMAGIESTLRAGLSPADQALQHNVFYTLRADGARRFNIIGFPDARNRQFWQSTGPGHFVIQQRALARTDPKEPLDAATEPGGGGSEGGDPENSGNPPANTPRPPAHGLEPGDG